VNTWYTLSDVAKIDRKAASDEDRRCLPYIGLDDIDKEVGHFSGDFRRKPETMLASKFRFTPKHILYGKLRPYLNKVVLPYFDGVCTTEILPILPDEKKVDRVYLYALLLEPKFVKWASANVSGANLPRISPERLAEYRFALPSLDEQKRIATLLDKMLLANPHYGFRARQTACDHACHRPVRRAPLRFASSILTKPTACAALVVTPKNSATASCNLSFWRCLVIL